jgi:hypothetical protein
VVQIVDQFRKGDLNVNAQAFIPQPIPENTPVDVNPVKVVGIINKDCHSTDKGVDRTKRSVEKMQSQIATNSSQQAVTREIVEIYEEINVKCEDNLQKVTEVKSACKRGNFKNFGKKKKFQAVMNRRICW